MADAIRWRAIGGVVVGYFEPGGRPSDELVQRWHAALGEARVCLIASTGALEPSVAHRRATTRLLLDTKLPVVLVSDDRANRALAKLLVWMGVSTRTIPWSQLDELAEELVGSTLAGSLSSALSELRDQGSIRLARG